MYDRLRTIEANLQRGVTASDLPGFESGLANIDREISILGIPKKYSEMFFNIKSHVDVVRGRLEMRRAELHSQTATAAWRVALTKSPGQCRGLEFGDARRLLIT